MALVYRLLVGLAVISAPVAAQTVPTSGVTAMDLQMGSKPGNPMASLETGQRRLSSFGERPVFSPDGRKIAFIGETYGDAFEYDRRSGVIRSLTAHFPHRGFLRVQYLQDGSYLLLGPHAPAATREETRQRAIELFWLDSAATGPAVPLDTTVWEGIATSPLTNTIAWTQTSRASATDPTITGSVLKRGKVHVDGAATRLVDVEEVVQAPRDCVMEAQDFLADDRGLTISCYVFDKRIKGGFAGSVASIDFSTKAITRYATPADTYAEVEGIFPDRRRTLVECSADRSVGMDLCVLDLQSRPAGYTRLTRVMDYGNWKYGNAVVSPDGSTIATQIAPGNLAEVGAGQGIVLIDLGPHRRR